MPLDAAAFAVHRDSGEITDVLVGSGQAVKQSRLAAVLVSRQRERERACQRPAVRFLISRLICDLAVSGVRGFLQRREAGHAAPDRLLDRPLIRFFDFYLSGFRISQGKLIPVDPELCRVSHRSRFYHSYSGAGYHSHIKEMLPERTASADGLDDRGLVLRQFIKKHTDPCPGNIYQLNFDCLRA